MINGAAEQGDELPAVVALPDAFSAAVEAWIEAHIRGGPLEPHILDLREALPELYAELVTRFFGAV